MSRTLRILGRAQTDVDDIFNWLAGRSLQGAVSWYFAFRRTVERVTLVPERFPEALEVPLLARQLR
jgi:plasmid stabilization system protein ParE